MRCNCYQLGDDGRCRVLTEEECTYPKCSFYCTEEQVRQAKQKTAERLSTLERTEQMAIAGKYYKGDRWWRDKLFLAM